MSIGEHHDAGPEHRLERLVFFSDAVFAIAITLLVIELHPPHLHPGANSGEYLMALAQLTPNFFGFTISFFVIGAFWAGHHRAFALASQWSDRLVFPSLVLLFAIAAMPFFTALSSSNSSGRVPTLMYCGWLLFAAVCNMRLQRLVTAPPVVDARVPPASVALVRRRGAAVVAGALTAILLVAVLPYPAQGLIGLATIGLWRRILPGGAPRTP